MGKYNLTEYCTLYNRPELLREWDKEKNKDLTPDNAFPYSKIRVFWRCEKGHSWQATITSRVVSKVGCPVCAGKVVVQGENDLATLYPEIAAQWHPTKNGDLMPNMVRPKTHRKVWWRCEKGHEWLVAVESRTDGKNCPICAGRIVAEGVNDLATHYPEIAKEWHPTKNGDLTPNMVAAKSNRNVWWMDKFGHEWRTRVTTRVRGDGCPICTNRKLLTGFNDLQTRYPELAKEWDSEKNGITPDKVMNSTKKVWWRCPNGHEYQAQLSTRIYQGTGCPICSGRVVAEGVNDLATLYPEIAAQWHPTKNGDLKPSMVVGASNKKVWWQDAHGHEWKTSVAARTSNGYGCPYCSGKKVLVGYNDLASQEPEIAAEWHPALNGTKTPEMFTRGSNKSVWWQCSEGHVWRAPINRRCYNRAGCPVCGGTVSKKKLAKYERMMREALAEQNLKKY